MLGTLVSGTARFGAADLGRGFFDTGNRRAARITASSFDSRLLRGLFKGVRRFGTVLPGGWRRGVRVLRAARTAALDFRGGSIDSLVVRAARVGTVARWGRFLDRFALRAARIRALALDGRLFGRVILRTKRDNAGIRGRLLDRPRTFTRALSQVEMALRGLVHGDGAVAAAGIQ